MNQIIVLCGPTASGKSSVAIEIAKQKNGVIINADALQIYKELPIITSSPSKQDLNKAPHHLYNHISVTEDYSVATYIQEVLEVIGNLPEDKTPIIVGGTGLYINSLIYGMHKIPDINKDLRKEIRKQAEEQGISYIYEKLKEVDEESASKLNMSNTKRICRAYEVFMETGKTINSFYTDENFYQPLAGHKISTFLFMPEREFLYQNCDARFDAFLKKGAVNEAANLLGNWDQWNTTAKKALGLEEIISYLKGETSLEDATLAAKQRTRNFAKRQITWFKNQLKEPSIISFANAEEYELCLSQIIKHI
jgi:tRNA dimethylallyltransferase